VKATNHLDFIISDHFKRDLSKFEDKFAEIMQSNIPLIDSVAKYLVRNKGKNLRPMLVLMSARMCGEPTERTYISSAIVELLHVATLIHDDVLDDSDMRRGFQSIKAKWGNKIAILMGDYLLSKSLIGGSMTGKIEVITLMSDAAKRLTKGELFQLQKSRSLDITEAEYYQLIGDKTAALISTCAELGALSVDASKEQQTALANYGENIGIAFQIKDDLLDYQSKSFIIGKPAGQDLLDKKLTLPIIHAMKENQDSSRIVKAIQKAVKKQDIKTVLDYVHQHKGLEYAEIKAKEFAQKAKDNLAIFPDSEAKSQTLTFIDYVINRKK
jgi:octaprenyl-diphosphate synthase